MLFTLYYSPILQYCYYIFSEFKVSKFESYILVPGISWHKAHQSTAYTAQQISLGGYSFSQDQLSTLRSPHQLVWINV